MGLRMRAIHVLSQSREASTLSIEISKKSVFYGIIYFQTQNWKTNNEFDVFIYLSRIYN